jgi:predicted tellurium resistance membrane protein TerC
LQELIGLAADPTAWIALATLIAMEVVIGVNNLCVRRNPGKENGYVT